MMLTSSEVCDHDPGDVCGRCVTDEPCPACHGKGCWTCSDPGDYPNDDE